MLLFWGCKGINNSANIFAFAVKSDKSTREKARSNPIFSASASLTRNKNGFD
jgi:hypothetical protein